MSYQQLKQVGFLVRPAQPSIDDGLTGCPQALLPAAPTVVWFKRLVAAMRQGLGVVLDAYDDLVLVGEAENGEQAVQLAEALKPDVIVMDIQMPVKDGLAAIQEIADELEISSTTVATHVRNILGKLHLANRTQAALYAVEKGISISEQE